MTLGTIVPQPCLSVPSHGIDYQGLEKSLIEWRKILLELQLATVREFPSEEKKLPPAQELLAYYESAEKKKHERKKVLKKVKKNQCSENFFAILRNWFLDHFHFPYPADSDLKSLKEKTKSKGTAQISTWFRNVRVHIWKPYVERCKNEKKKPSAEEFRHLLYLD
jgi:hypothetical protein